MKQYCYVVVESTGRSCPLSERDEDVTDPNRWHTLPKLLRQGWHPVRETPMSGGGVAVGGAASITLTGVSYSLVLLEKEDNFPSTKDKMMEELSRDLGTLPPSDSG